VVESLDPTVTDEFAWVTDPRVTPGETKARRFLNRGSRGRIN
jgi:hypothetical protein